VSIFAPPADPLEGLPVVLDFDEIPLDGFHQDENGDWVDEEEPDEDNSVLGEFTDHALPPDHPQLKRPRQTGPPRQALARVVGPLRRELRFKRAPKMMHGKDVRAIYRALSRAGIVRWKPGGLFPLWYGTGLRRHVIRFQRRKGLNADGVYGPATHRALAPYFDAYGIKMYQDAKIGLTGAELDRQQFRSYCLFLYHWRDRVHYTMSASRMSIVRRRLTFQRVWSQGDLWEDCSSIGKGLYKWIGRPDPNGYGYDNPWGYTGTMLKTGSKVAYSGSGSLRVGDAILTGNYPYVHVWYYIGSGLGFSHGKESDPRIVPHAYRPITRVQRYIKER
jgi:hypothetical protein